jgi:hypothetical protein
MPHISFSRFVRIVNAPMLLMASLICTIFVLFPCLVQDAFSEQVTLSWDPPTTNTDGTPLTDLSGYKVYYGTTTKSYSQTIDAGNTNTYTVSNLSNGTFYFAVTAYDVSRNESAYSNEVSKTIQTTSQCTLTVNRTGNGTITGTGINCGSDCTEPYNQGTVVTLTASPGSGSSFSAWSGGGCSGAGQCILTMNANTSVTATFTGNTNTITASAGSGGSISPSGSVSVNQGGSQAFTISPNTGYRISDVRVDNTSVGAVSSYTFSNVTAAHTIQASFSSSPSYTIAASAGTGGSISPSGSVRVNQGGRQAFTITPNTGYYISAVMVDGTSVGAVSSYTFSNVTVAHTIRAYFTRRYH